MKTNIPSTTRRRDGGALVLTAVILVIVGSVLATYLVVAQSEYKLVARSQIWGNSMAMTEAGVEDALGFINKYRGNFAMITNWATAASAAEDHWTISGSTYATTRTVNAKGDSYTVTIDNSNPAAPVINSTGSAGWNLSAATPFMLAVGGTVNTIPAAPAQRRVQVTATYSSLFPGAITTQTNINLNGNNVRVDSFDSTTNTASVWNAALGYGTYPTGDATKIRAHGDVATDSSIVGAISVGQANIYGRVRTGPGGTSTVGNNGYVGPLPQVGSGIQAGYSSDDMNVVFPSVVLPAGAAGWQSVPASGVITNSGNYYIAGITSSLTINADHVTIYVNGSISLSGGQSIGVSTNTSRVVMYVAGPSFSLNGQATINNETKRPSVLGLYGLPSLTSIDLSGNAAFSGTVYAPQADYTFGGGGNNTQDMIGALVAKSCVLNGHANFHYDESLKRNGPGIGYIPTAWKEIIGN